MKSKHKEKDGLLLIHDCSVIILCGGTSGRMGFNKAFAPFKGTTLLEYVLNQMRLIFKDIIVVVRELEKYSHLKQCRIMTDDPIIKGRGPLSGIYTGLKNIRNSRAFVIACDMPGLSNQFINHINQAFELAKPRVLFTTLKGRIEPLCSIYSKKTAPIIYNMLLSGEKKTSAIVDYAKTLFFPITDEKIVFNINTPEDLNQANHFLDRVSGNKSDQ